MQPCLFYTVFLHDFDITEFTKWEQIPFFTRLFCCSAIPKNNIVFNSNFASVLRKPMYAATKNQWRKGLWSEVSRFMPLYVLLTCGSQNWVIDFYSQFCFKVLHVLLMDRIFIFDKIMEKANVSLTTHVNCREHRNHLLDLTLRESQCQFRRY